MKTATVLHRRAFDKEPRFRRLAKTRRGRAAYLTAVEQVCLRYGKPDEQRLGRVSVAEAETYIAEGHFAPGSMLPKIQAAIRFAKSKPGRRAIITSLDKAVDALQGTAGTTISL
jgi:carbamate kinase